MPGFDIRFYTRLGIKHLLRGGALGIGRAVLRRPRLKQLARRALARFPSLRTRVQAALYRASLAQAAPRPGKLHAGPRDNADLTPRTLRMLRALELAARRPPPP